jgi:hypothetical protein
MKRLWSLKQISDRTRALGILVLFVVLVGTSFAQAQVLFGDQAARFVRAQH